MRKLARQDRTDRIYKNEDGKFKAIVKEVEMLHAKGHVDGRPARGLISICAAGGQGVVAILEAH